MCKLALVVLIAEALVRPKELGFAGWLLFMVFAGVGMVAFPLDLFREFMGRPRATITHSEYIKRARGLGMRAKGIKVGSVSSLVQV